MPTIEERLNAVIAYTVKYGEPPLYLADIIADWNAAKEAMKDIIAVDIDTKHGCHYCHGCHSDLPNHSERHTPETCRIARLQAAIARLEGLTDPRDSGTIDGEEE